MSSLVSWNWRLDRGALRHCGKCFRKVQLQHSCHRVYLWSGCYLEPPITWIKDGAYFVAVLISTFATRKTIYTDLVFFTPCLSQTVLIGLWSVALVVGALGDGNDDFLILLVCCPRLLIGRHLEKRNTSSGPFVAQRFRVIPADLSKCPTLNIIQTHRACWKQLLHQYEKPYRQTRTHVCTNLVLEANS